MKSNYSATRPLMKMSSPEMMSSRPQHETTKPQTIAAATAAVRKEPGKQGGKNRRG